MPLYCCSWRWRRSYSTSSPSRFLLPRPRARRPKVPRAMKGLRPGASRRPPFPAVPTTTVAVEESQSFADQVADKIVERIEEKVAETSDATGSDSVATSASPAKNFEGESDEALPATGSAEASTIAAADSSVPTTPDGDVQPVAVTATADAAEEATADEAVQSVAAPPAEGAVTALDTSAQASSEDEPATEMSTGSFATTGDEMQAGTVAATTGAGTAAGDQEEVAAAEGEPSTDSTVAAPPWTSRNPRPMRNCKAAATDPPALASPTDSSTETAPEDEAQAGTEAATTGAGTDTGDSGNRRRRGGTEHRHHDRHHPTSAGRCARRGSAHCRHGPARACFAHRFLHKDCARGRSAGKHRGRDDRRRDGYRRSGNRRHRGGTEHRLHDRHHPASAGRRARRGSANCRHGPARACFAHRFLHKDCARGRSAGKHRGRDDRRRDGCRRPGSRRRRRENRAPTPRPPPPR